MWAIPIVIILLIAVSIIALRVAIHLWPRRANPGGYEFIAILIALAIWATGDAVELAVSALEAKVFWRMFQQFGIVALPPLWLLFAIAYLDLPPWSRSRARLLILLMPLLTLIVALTNQWHGLFFRELRLSAGPLPQLEVAPGQWFWLHIAYSYLCLTVGLALIFGAFWHSSPLFRRQAIVLGIGLSLPFISNWWYLSQITNLGVDLTPVVFLFSAPFIMNGLYRHQFLRLAPIARNRLIEAMADAMLVVDREGRVVDFNPAAQRLFAPQINHLLTETLNWPDLLYACQREESARIELSCPHHPDRFFDITIDLLRDRRGEIGGRMLVFREITERKRSEQQLREALDRFTSMVEHTPLVAIQRFDRQGVILAWNRVCETFYGYTAAEACGRRLQDLILSGEEACVFEQHIEQIWQSGQALPPREWRARTKTGEVRWIYSSMFPLFAQGKVSDIVCMDVDITGIRRAEEHMRRQRDQLAALHQLTLDWLNRREIDDLLKAITDSAHQLFTAAYVELLLWNESEQTLDVRACSPPLPGHMQRRETPERAPLSWRAFQSRQPALVDNYTEWPEHTPEYAALQFGPTMVLPIVIGDRSVGVIGIARPYHAPAFEHTEIQYGLLMSQLAAMVLDNASLYAAAQREIAERKQAEQQQAKLQTQLLQAQKMEAIGQLAGGIAHDFNNLLTVITGNVEIALLDIEPTHPAYAELEAIRQSTARATELVRQLLTFARRQPGQPKVININRHITGVVTMMERLLGAKITLRLELADELDQVSIDPHQFEQVLINLIVNARDAMPDGGQITIRTTTAVIPPADIPLLSQPQTDRYVVLSVCDTGTGIDEAIKPHLFEPYFTTKPIGKGSGLGLAICNGIVSQHGGFMTVESQPGMGSCFTVALPAVSGKPSPTNEETHVIDCEQAAGNETILLVEDDAQVRKLTARILREHGYTVIEAANADEALNYAQQPETTLHILITDIILPQTDGITLANRLQTIFPHLRIVLMSGYVQRMLSDGSHPPYTVLSKPFSRHQLLTIIRQVMAEQA